MRAVYYSESPSRRFVAHAATPRDYGLNLAKDSAKGAQILTALNPRATEKMC
jgi:hypothetical protein